MDMVSISFPRLRENRRKPFLNALHLTLDYFWAMSELIDQAKESIFVSSTFWCLKTVTVFALFSR
jgi:phosphatidylserine/phosphatidylglycerophosphate/cardiolipin synthase-like enzyme